MICYHMLHHMLYICARVIQCLHMFLHVPISYVYIMMISTYVNIFNSNAYSMLTYKTTWINICQHELL